MRKEIITFREPKSPISEIFRTLRTNIQFANNKRGLHSLLITSTTPGEGKSWVSANLAVAFAQAGKRVVLVDCDMRKGRQFSMFGVAPTPGLSNFLSGINSNGEESNPDILSYLRSTEVENLYVITAGNVPPNPSELLDSKQMEKTIEDLKSVCDLVIFDGTPCSLVTDSVIISRYVDTTLIVSAYKMTKMEDLQKAKREIENVGGKIAGVVINKVPTSQKQYYSTYYYGELDENSNGRRSKKEQEYIVKKKKEDLREKSKNVISQNRIDLQKEKVKIEKTQPEEKVETIETKQEKAKVVEATENENKSGTLYDFDKEVENNSGIYDFDKEVVEEPKGFGALELIKQMSKYVDEEKEKLRRKEG